MIIDCISDLHGYEPKLEGGDLLIIAGDLTASDLPLQYWNFLEWVKIQPYKKIIIIAGNHDNFIENLKSPFIPPTPDWKDILYLCDSGTEFEGLKIWGTPWTAQFPGINPHCCAFTVRHFDHTDEILNEYWQKIPDDTDILISHGPSWGLHDTLHRSDERVGSPSLTNWIARHVNTLKLFVCGHIHEGHGIWNQRELQMQYNKKTGPIFVNASYINEDYEPVNKPIRIIL